MVSSEPGTSLHEVWTQCLQATSTHQQYALQVCKVREGIVCRIAVFLSLSFFFIKIYSTEIEYTIHTLLFHFFAVFGKYNAAIIYPHHIKIDIGKMNLFLASESMTFSPRAEHTRP